MEGEGRLEGVVVEDGGVEVGDEEGLVGGFCGGLGEEGLPDDVFGRGRGRLGGLSPGDGGRR